MNHTCPEFLAHDCPCFDVRSPKEYAHAHLPGAISLPLFSDEERAIVGTAYKKQGKEVAIRLGVKLVGPKLASMLDAVDKVLVTSKSARVYCWRGGMRSGFVRYFLETIGIPTVQLKGGYKAYRRYCLNTLQKPYKLFVVGGFTGCGKTEVLKALSNKNQVVDLEALASHRGSVYGDLVEPLPSCEQFENELAYKLIGANGEAAIWVEDESRLIGRCQIPTPFYDAMLRAPLYIINCPLEARIERILALYSKFSKEQLIVATNKIARRLGGQHTKQVLGYIEQGMLADAVKLLLEYYDKAYEHAITKHKGPIIRLPEQNLTAQEWAVMLSGYKL